MCVYVCGVLCAMCVGGLVVDGNQTNKKTWPLYGFREQIPGWFLHCFTVVILLFRLRSGKKKNNERLRFVCSVTIVYIGFEGHVV